MSLFSIADIYPWQGLQYNVAGREAASCGARTSRLRPVSSPGYEKCLLSGNVCIIQILI